MYDLEERTLDYARKIKSFVKKLPRTLINIEYGKQLIRSGGSVGANYIEANEALGKKDFMMRIRISKKESKESRYWLRLVDIKKENEPERSELIQETNELMKIFGKILENSK